MHHVVSERQRQRSLLAVDFLEGVLECGREERTIAHHAVVVFVGETTLHLVQPQFIGGIVHGLDAGKERLVHVHLVVLRGNHGSEDLGQLVHLRRVVALDKGHEHVGHLVERLATVVDSQHGVLKVGALGVVHDGSHLGILLVDAGLQGGQIVLILDFLERRNLILRSIRRQEGILLFHSRFLCGSGCRCQASNCQDSKE